MEDTILEITIRRFLPESEHKRYIFEIKEIILKQKFPCREKILLKNIKKEYLFEQLTKKQSTWFIKCALEELFINKKIIEIAGLKPCKKTYKLG